MSRLLFLTAAGLAFSTAGPIAELPFGQIEGFAVSRNMHLQQPFPRDVCVFMNIPYAKHPERFKPPQALDSSDNWSDTRDCTHRSHSCVESEDCLYLNIYTPNLNSPTKLPVMLFIHGGAYVSGQGAAYNGTATSAVENVVVVTINYRLGSIGFMASSGLQSDNDMSTTGNWAMLDQQMAMKWVQEHIAIFGGDKDRVLIYGESAGAFSIAWHMGAPGSKGLFHAAVAESGTDSEWIFQKKEDAFKFYDWVAQQGPGCKNANDLECLRKAPFESFTLPSSLRNDPNRAPTWAPIMYPSCPYGPVIDGHVFPMLPSEAARKGRQNDVPLIMGTNKNDGSIFVVAMSLSVHGFSVPPIEAELPIFTQYVFGDNDDAKKKFLSLYPLGTDGYSKVFDQISDGFRDALFVCPSRRLSRAWNQDHVYTYQLIAKNLFPTMFDIITLIKSSDGLDDVHLADIGTYHGSDLGFVFKMFREESLNIADLMKQVKHMNLKDLSSMFDVVASLYLSNPARESMHTLSDTLTCMWAAMSSSADPNSQDHTCGGSYAKRVDWKSGVENYMRFYYNNKGDNEMNTVRADGKAKEGSLYLPSDEICDFWDEQLAAAAFRNFRADLGGSGGGSGDNTASPNDNMNLGNAYSFLSFPFGLISLLLAF